VGTSTAFFREAIKACRLPATIIGKLKLDFPQTRARQYGRVHMEYRWKAALLHMHCTTLPAEGTKPC
jgi:hypothetical protein